MTNKYIKNTQGFTLVELSIVIIIIGFLIAGIASGQSLIRQAQLNSAIRQITDIKSGFAQFKTIYSFKPGDFPNAYAYWGAVGGCTNASVYADPNGCNGNGDGIIDDYKEAYLMWKHLNLAGLLPGSYTGKLTVGWAEGAGIDYPATAIPNSGINAGYDSYWGMFPIQEYMSLGVGSYFPLLKPIEAKQIDTKMDDGNPVKGEALAGNPTGGDYTCMNGAYPENLGGATDYLLSNDNVACRMIFKLNFPDQFGE